MGGRAGRYGITLGNREGQRQRAQNRMTRIQPTMTTRNCPRAQSANFRRCNRVEHSRHVTLCGWLGLPLDDP
jgi:hypothetical protein